MKCFFSLDHSLLLIDNFGSQRQKKNHKNKTKQTNKTTQQTPETYSELLFIVLLLKCISCARSSCFHNSQNARNFGILLLSYLSMENEVLYANHCLTPDRLGSM